MTIDQLFCQTAETLPQATAIDDGIETLTFAEVQERARSVAASLAATGVAAAEPVAVMVANRAQDLAAFLGVWMAGAVVVPVHQTTPAPARSRLFARLANRFLIDGKVRTIGHRQPPVRPLLDQAGTIIFTSGSTGQPKGVVLSHERAASKLAMIGRMTDWQAGENTLMSLQLTFSFGQWASWLTLVNGGCVHLRSRLDADGFHALLDSGKVSRFPAVPTMLRRLLDTGRDSSFAGCIMAGGEALHPALGTRLRSAFPHARLGDIYGLTETGTCDFFVAPDAYDSLAGTIGTAGEQIQWRLAPDTGELQIRSPWQMLGYLDEPAMTDDATVDGWFRTGDLAMRGAGESVRLIGRARDIIVRSGNKIAPLEIEAVFIRHPAVRAALVAGVSDGEGVESIHMAVVVDPAQPCTGEQLREWALTRLERYKLPEFIHFVDELPGGHTGKADRRAFQQRVGLWKDAGGTFEPIGITPRHGDDVA